jgi:hypothetical protein
MFVESFRNIFFFIEFVDIQFIFIFLIAKK